jgi:transposase
VSPPAKALGRQRLHRRPGRLGQGEAGPAIEIVKRTDDEPGFRVVPRRWVVDRAFGWLMRSRRLARNDETRPDSAEAMPLWSMTMVMSRRLARRGASRLTLPAPPARTQVRATAAAA